MKIYCMSDIHGCIDAFNEALLLVLDHLDEPDTKLLLLGDYIHGGNDNHGVIDKIMDLQEKYGQEKVIALLGNHEEFVLVGDSTIDSMWTLSSFKDEDYRDTADEDEKYLQWLENLPRYYVEGNTIFVHAGIDEDAGDLWEFNTDEETFVGKYPPETGKIEGLDMKVVAGHVGTSVISGDPTFNEIYYDGESHYYIDGSVLDTGVIPVLMVDTETDQYYRVAEGGNWLIQPYEE